jgi:gluconolactonase
MKNISLLLSAIISFYMISCTFSPGNPVQEQKNNDPLTELFKVEIYDSTALELISPDAGIEILARGFYWSEGPLWIDELQSLIFSDVPANKIYIWNEKDSLGVYLESAGHSGEENKNSDRGSNGLLLDSENRLLLCQHGDRRIARMNAELKSPQETFFNLADTYNDMKFNSPNDLAIDHAGNIYFTDPPYGQPGNKTGEIGINGVFKTSRDHEVSLLVDSLTWPNGIALSLDQKTLYINQSDPNNPVLYSYEINQDGSLSNGKILFDFAELAKTHKGLPDGLKIHRSGVIFATGPGGVHLISPEGKHLAAVKTGKSTANCAFDSDQKYLYTTTTDMLLRIRLR